MDTINVLDAIETKKAKRYLLYTEDMPIAIITAQPVIMQILVASLSKSYANVNYKEDIKRETQQTQQKGSGVVFRSLRKSSKEGK